MSDLQPMPAELQRSSRDREAVRAALEKALAGYLKTGKDHVVGELAGTSATGMSSETLLFDASWVEDGLKRTESLVARVAPDPQDVPVFPRYDLPGQFATIAAVSELTDVPVPPDHALAVVHLPRAASEGDAIRQAVATARRPS